MAKLIYSAITSLDGYVADEDGTFDWAKLRRYRLGSYIREPRCGRGPPFHVLQLRRTPQDVRNPYPRTPAMAAGVADHILTLRESQACSTRLLIVEEPEESEASDVKGFDWRRVDWRLWLSRVLVGASLSGWWLGRPQDRGPGPSLVLATGHARVTP